MINILRSDLGLSQVQKSDFSFMMARIKADDMMINNKFDHDPSFGKYDEFYK